VSSYSEIYFENASLKNRISNENETDKILNPIENLIGS
jgi:hypothetical protein